MMVSGIVVAGMMGINLILQIGGGPGISNKLKNCCSYLAWSLILLLFAFWEEESFDGGRDTITEGRN